MICQRSGRNRLLKARASSSPRKPKRRIDLMPVAEKRRASTPLRIATANDAVRLNTSTADKNAAGGASTAPLQLARLTVASAVIRIKIETPQPYATTSEVLLRTPVVDFACAAADSALAGATNSTARRAYARSILGSKNVKPLYQGTRIPKANTVKSITTACRAMGCEY